MSLSPPIVSFGLSRGGRMHEVLHSSGRFCVNILAQDQGRIATAFANPANASDELLSAIPHSTSDAGLPVLHGSLGAIHCSVLGTHIVGDHDLWLGQVDAVQRTASCSAPAAY